MEALIGYLGVLTPTFLLVFARAVGVFTQAPVLSNRNIPAPVRLAMAATISIIVLTLLPAPATVPASTLGFALMAAWEFVLGALFGYAASLLFLAIQSGGELSGVQAGLSFASTMNPLLRSNVNPFGTLYLNVGYLLFLIIGGHTTLIGGFVQSFKLVPIGTFTVTGATAEQFFLIAGAFLAITLQLALPAILVLFMTDLGLGYINKAAQQASNITELVQAVKPLAGLVLVLLLLPNLMTAVHGLTDKMLVDLDLLLRLSGPNR